jgi:hypothetical protein
MGPTANGMEQGGTGAATNKAQETKTKDTPAATPTPANKEVPKPKKEKKSEGPCGLPAKCVIL